MRKIALAKNVDGVRVRATIDVDIKRIEKPAMTVDHKEINQYKTISISGSISGGNFGAFGQCLDQINEVFGDNNHVATILRIWKEYHLNDMQAGCVHQPKDGYPVNADQMTQRCQESGYKYGSGWLVKEIPEAVIEELRGAVIELDSLPSEPSHVEFFCKEHNIILKKTMLLDETKDGSEFRITLTKGQKTFVIPSFKQGSAIRGSPKLDSIILCLVSDARCPDSFEEFCAELGYEEDSRNAESIFKAVLEQTKKLKEFLGDSFEEFTQIQEG